MSLNERMAGLVASMPHNGASTFTASPKQSFGHPEHCYKCKLEAILAAPAPQPQGVSAYQMQEIENVRNILWEVAQKDMDNGWLGNLGDRLNALLAQPAPAASEYRSYAIGKDDFKIHPVFLGLLAKAEAKGRAEGLEEANLPFREARQRVNCVEAVMRLPYIKAQRDTEEGQIRFVARDDVITAIRALAATQPEQKGEGDAQAHSAKTE